MLQTETNNTLHLVKKPGQVWMSGNIYWQLNGIFWIFEHMDNLTRYYQIFRNFISTVTFLLDGLLCKHLKCPFDQIFVRHIFTFLYTNRSSLDILPNFNLLQSIERTFFGPLLPSIYGRHKFSNGIIVLVNSQTAFCRRFLFPRLKLKTSCGKFLNLAHYFPYDIKLQLLAHSRSFF